MADPSTIFCCRILIISLFCPYKNNYFNIIDSLAFASLALTAFLLMIETKVKSFPIQLSYVLELIPFLYFILLVLYKISRVALFRTCCSRIKEKIQARNKTQNLHIQRSDNTNEDLPDRIVNPEMYQPLLSATK